MNRKGWGPANLALCAFASLLVSGGAAKADIIGFDASWDPVDVLVSDDVGPINAFSFTFDIGSTAVPVGNASGQTIGCPTCMYVAGTDTVISATLNIWLDDPNQADERIQFTVNAANLFTSDPISGLDNLFTFTSGPSNTATTFSLATFSANGLLQVTLTQVAANPGSSPAREFYFDRTQLTGSYQTNGDDPDPREIPEPGTLAIFGIGALGYAFMRRRRRSQS